MLCGNGWLSDPIRGCHSQSREGHRGLCLQETFPDGLLGHIQSHSGSPEGGERTRQGGGNSSALSDFGSRLGNHDGSRAEAFLFTGALRSSQVGIYRTVKKGVRPSQPAHILNLKDELPAQAGLKEASACTVIESKVVLPLDQTEMGCFPAGPDYSPSCMARTVLLEPKGRKRQT